MITIANTAKGWIINPDFIEYDEGANQITFRKGNKTFWYQPPDGVTFENIIHGIEVCRGALYRLP